VPENFGMHVIAGIKALTNNNDWVDQASKNTFFKSVYTQRVHSITPSIVDEKAFIDDILSLCSQDSYDIILPFTNSSYYAISKHAKTLSKFARFMVPSLEQYTLANDKFNATKFCEKIGVQTPKVFSEYQDNDIVAISKAVQYPVVIKAKSGQGVFKGLRFANNPDELKLFYDQINSIKAANGSENYSSPLIQEFVPGFIHDACTLTHKGNIINVLTQKRHVMYPIYGGVGAVNVTTHNPEIDELARKLLEALEWNGPAQIEFKLDPRDNKYKFIEINPKLWGTLDLSIKVGMNFPKMIRNILLEEEVEKNIKYPSGVRYKFIFPATLAYLQLLNEFGIKGACDPVAYSKTLNDFDINDPLILANRLMHTIWGIISTAGKSPNSNINKNLINSLKLN